VTVLQALVVVIRAAHVWELPTLACNPTRYNP